MRDTRVNARLIYVAIAARCDIQCPRIQNAIDAMAQDFRDGRAGLLRYLRREGDTPTPPERMGSLISYILEVWQPYLKDATGQGVDFYACAARFHET